MLVSRAIPDLMSKTCLDDVKNSVWKSNLWKIMCRCTGVIEQFLNIRGMCQDAVNCSLTVLIPILFGSVMD